MSEHQHEKWQLLDSAQGGQYCGACGDHVQVIPDAAVEAALDAFYRGSAPIHPHDKAFMRAALEAAAPHLMAQALEEAADELDLPGSDATGYYASEQDSGYREAERHAEAYLRARAAEMTAK